MGQHRDYAALMTVSKNICVTCYCHCLNMVIYVRWKIDLFCLWHSAQRCQVTAATHTGEKKSNVSRARLFVFLAAVSIAHVELQHQHVVGT